MKSKKSRLVSIGLLALVLSVTVGLLSGSAADAKKKKKKGTTSFTITKTTPTAIPLATPSATGYIKVPIGTLASKTYKGKIVSLRGISVTTTFTGDPGFANNVGATLIGPSGRTSNISSPFANHFTPPPSETSSGPTTETPNSPTSTCTPSTPAPPPPCANPDQTLGPPYIGTIGNVGLLVHSGISPAGTWIIRLSDSSATTHATLNSITVTGGLIKSLPTK
jgi:hypothetical protein